MAQSVGVLLRQGIDGSIPGWVTILITFTFFQKSEKEKPSTGEEKKTDEKTDKPPEEKKPEEKKEGEGEKKPEEPKVRYSKGYCSF